MANADLAYQHALDHLSSGGFESLSERERDLVVLWQVEAEVNNGGFELYYSGAAGDQAFHAPEALARVGALEKAAIVGEANALFGPVGPPRDRAERLKMIAMLRTQSRFVFDELERRYFQDADDVDELVEAYLSQRG